MYLHLGQDTIIRQSEIVGIFDLDTATVMKSTRDFLRDAQARGEVITVGEELPKSFVLIIKNNRQNIYLAAMGSITLQKRLEQPIIKGDAQ